MRRHRGKIVLFALGTLILAGLILFSDGPNADRVAAVLSGTISPESAINASTDSDNDGIKDWEEVIRGTNPYGTDSDNDGTPDGDEIAANRDPLKAGDDSIALPALGQAKNSQDIKKLVDEGENATELLMQRLLDERGVAVLGPENTAEMSGLLNSYLRELKTTMAEEEDAAVRNMSITIAGADDGAAVARYFNAVAAAYEQRVIEIREDDLTILARAFAKKNPSELEKLARYRTIAEALRSDLERIPTPRSVADFHKRELYHIARTIEQLKMMERINLDDAMIVLIATSLRYDIKTASSALHATEVPEWIKKHKIVFAPDAKARLLYRID